MKRIIFVFLVLLTFPGCNMKNKEMDRIIMLRQKLNSGVVCVFDAYITADYGEKLYSFVLKCKADELGNLFFSVMEPQSITGISGEISSDNGVLTFDDKVLAFSLLADGQITPVSAPWIMMQTLRGGYIKACGIEDKYLCVEFDDSYEKETIQVDIWLDEMDGPVYADFVWDGRRIIAMEVKNFQYL